MINHKINEKVSYKGAMYIVKVTKDKCQMDGTYCPHCFNYKTCFGKSIKGGAFKKFRKL